MNTAAAPVAAKTQQQIDRNNGKPWRSRITLRLKPPDALPSRLRSLQTFVDTSWLGTTTIRTLYPARATFAILHRTFAPIVRVPTGPPDRRRQAARAGHAWRWPMQLFLSLLIVFPTCLQHSHRFHPLFLGTSILSGISLSWGLQPPFTSLT